MKWWRSSCTQAACGKVHGSKWPLQEGDVRCQPCFRMHWDWIMLPRITCIQPCRRELIHVYLYNNMTSMWIVSCLKSSRWTTGLPPTWPKTPCHLYYSSSKFTIIDKHRHDFLLLGVVIPAFFECGRRNRIHAEDDPTRHWRCDVIKMERNLIIS